jgi:hypothetical protein
LGRFDKLGFWSMYTPRRDRDLVARQKGWVLSNRGRDAWGTQAMCFPRCSAEILLEYHPLYAEDQLRGATDAIVAQCFLEAGLPCYYHNPSLSDHLGRTSSVGHNWYDEHVGLDFDPEFQAHALDPIDDPVTSPETQKSGPNPKPRRLAVITFFQNNIPPEVVTSQAEVICRFLPKGCEFEPCEVAHHALGLDDYFRLPRHDAYLILDIDCIPLAEWVIPWFLENALAGMVVGAAQRANHLENGGHVYAGPCALAFSRATFKQLGNVSFRDTVRGDVGEELTYASERIGIPVTLLWPTRVTLPKWTLRPGVSFGLGTTFGGAVYHAFEISKGQTTEMFLRKCEEVLEGQGRLPQTLSQRATNPGGKDSPSISRVPVFHEQWYTDSELTMLDAAVRFIRPLQGAIVELGCWEGRSTSVIANACFPETVVAVDTWRGSSSEHPEHETVRIARERDVLSIFQENMRVLTRGNVAPKRLEATEFLRQCGGPIKFCHVDAAHDYKTVMATLEGLLARLVPGGVIFGHDYESAHSAREDLSGGVQRAVRELLPEHVSKGNNWWYVNMKRE